jgi:hypothetical protein
MVIKDCIALEFEASVLDYLSVLIIILQSQLLIKSVAKY